MLLPVRVTPALRAALLMDGSMIRLVPNVRARPPVPDRVIGALRVRVPPALAAIVAPPGPTTTDPLIVWAALPWVTTPDRNPARGGVPALTMIVSARVPLTS